MTRYTNGLIGGLALGLIIGASIHMTDDKHRRRMVKGSKRALRKAGDMFDDFRSPF